MSLSYSFLSFPWESEKDAWSGILFLPLYFFMGFYLEKRKERDKNMGRVEHVEPKRERKKERSVLQMKKKK